MFLHWSLESQNFKQKYFKNTLSKSSPTYVRISWTASELL